MSEAEAERKARQREYYARWRARQRIRGKVRADWGSTYRQHYGFVVPRSDALPAVGSRIGPGYTYVGPTDRCAYCGETPEHTDHTVPQHFRNLHRRAFARQVFYVVASCAECNMFASSKLDSTFYMRKQRIAVAFAKRYRDLLAMPTWTPEEVGGLGRGLNDYLSASVVQQRIARRRYRLLCDPTWPPGVPDDLWPGASKD